MEIRDSAGVPVRRKAARRKGAFAQHDEVEPPFLWDNIDMRLLAFVCVCATLSAQNFTREREQSAGRQMTDEARRSLRPIESQPVNDYLVRLGSRLTASLRADRAPAFTFKMIAEDTNSLHEPLAFWGGSSFVPLNLLLASRDEAEFAGMILQAMSRGPFVPRALPGTIPMILGCARDGLMNAAAAAQYRTREFQADREAALRLSQLGYDPSALARYIERTQGPDYRDSPFPSRKVRIAALNRATRGLPSTQYSQNQEFYQVQDRARAVACPTGAPCTLATPH